MNKSGGQKFSDSIGLYVRASSGLAFLVALLIVIPLTLWLTWAHRSTVGESVVLTLFCLSFAWLNVSILKCQRSFRRLGDSSSSRLFFGQAPEDPDELLAWRWGRHFRYSFLAVVLCMIAFGITKWINGDY